MEIKGIAIKWIPTYIKKNFGKDGLQKWLDTISAEAYTLYSVTIDEKEWFDIRKYYIEPMANVAQLFYGWDLKKAAWEFGRYSADITLKGVTRWMAKRSTPEVFIDKLIEILPTYYRPIKMEAVEKKQNSGIVRITEFTGMDKTTEFRLAGFGERILEIIGCMDVKVDITRFISNGDPYTEYKISWLDAK